MKFVLKIRKRTQNEWVTVAVLSVSMFLLGMIQLLKLSAVIKYIVDIGWVFLLLSLFLNKEMPINRETALLKRVVDMLFIITLAGAIIACQSPLQYLWGFRNNFRFFVFFFSCVYFLDLRNIDGYLKFLDRLYYLNFLTMLFQWFVLGKYGDYLGGIFGVEKGCNGYTIIFISIIITKAVVCYLNRKESLAGLILKSIVAITIAALAELKVFYAIFLFIIGAANIIAGFSVRKLKVLFVSVAVIFIGLLFLGLTFPSSLKVMTSQSLISIAASTNGYTSSGDLNRLTAVPFILTNVLRTPRQKILGLGLGNCDTSAVPLIQTEFFKKYGYLNYTWFSSAFMLLETGLLGLLSYILFFVVVFFCVHKIEKNNLADASYCQIAKILAGLCLILVIYNSSLRTEAGYMMYFALSLPFIKNKNNPD